MSARHSHDDRYANRTGGAAYTNRNDIDSALMEAIEPIAATYILGFYLPEAERDGSFHQLRVHVRREGVLLRYRQGYIAMRSQPTPPKRKKIALEALLASPADLNEVGIRLEGRATGSGLRKSLDLRATLIAGTIAAEPKGEEWSGSFDELLVESNAAGRIVGKLSDWKQFHITPATRDRFEREGLVYSLTVPLAPGAVTLRLLIRDRITGRTGSLTVPLENLAAAIVN
jgi:hypothetical protein